MCAVIREERKTHPPNPHLKKTSGAAPAKSRAPRFQKPKPCATPTLRANLGCANLHRISLTAIGVACGLVVALFVMRLMSTLLFKVSPVDLLAYGAASLGLAATAFLASYLPSRRASTVDPVEALRAE